MTAEKAMQATKVERLDDMPVEADSTGDKYVVERIVCQMDGHKGTSYLVGWYGYGSANKT